LEKMLSVLEARERLMSAVNAVETELVSIQHAAGRVLATEIISRLDLPSFDNSSMDGFALRADDIQDCSPENPIMLRVVADIPAGINPVVILLPGQAARIVTGAVIPKGGNVVVPVEATNLERFPPGSGLPSEVQILRSQKPGDYIRRRGQDIQTGDVILSPRRRLRPQDVGVLAMLGISEFQVYKQPRIGLLSSGDELLPVGVPLEPGKVYETNAHTLGALIIQNGGLSLPLGTSPDQIEAVRSFLNQAVEAKVDLILSSAGVSMGAYDYVKAVLEQDGRLNFWRVNMRPGKPLAFGHYRGIPFIGLPGNPVSAYVGFEVFVRPVLEKLAGLPDLPRQAIQARLREDVESDGRESYLRAVVTSDSDGWTARLTGHQGSGNLLSLVQANALLIIPSGVKFAPAGAYLQAWLLDH
jgi:molybdopterin molybdotransferase